MDAEKLRHDAGKLRNAVRKSVIARVEAVRRFAVFAVRKRGQHRVGETELTGTGFSAGHIERKPLFFDCFVLCAKRFIDGAKRFAG